MKTRKKKTLSSQITFAWIKLIPQKPFYPRALSEMANTSSTETSQGTSFSFRFHPCFCLWRVHYTQCSQSFSKVSLYQGQHWRVTLPGAYSIQTSVFLVAAPQVLRHTQTPWGHESNYHLVGAPYILPQINDLDVGCSCWPPWAIWGWTHESHAPRVLTQHTSASHTRTVHSLGISLWPALIADL